MTATETAIAVMSPAALDAKRQAVAELSRTLATCTVHDPKSRDNADGWLRMIISERSALEEMRKSAVGPLNEAVKRINGWFKPVEQMLAPIERHIREQIGGYVLAERQQQIAAYAAAAEAAAAGNHETARSALEVVNAANTDAGAGSSVRGVWKATIVDADAVPRAWCVPDEKRIAAMARATKGGKPTAIAGVVYEFVASLTVRGAK